MRQLLVMFVSAIACFAQNRSVTVASGQTLSFPYTSITNGNTIIEFGLEGIGSATGSNRIVHNDGTNECLILASTLNLRCRNTNDGTPDGLATVSIDSLAEPVRVRFQRTQNVSTGTSSLEVWDGAGENRRVSTKSTPGPSTTTSLTMTMSAAVKYSFWRWGTSLVSLASAAPADCPTSAMPNADFCFDNNLTDRSTHAWTMTYSGGTPSYSDTTGYNCSASFLAWLDPVTTRTGQAMPLTSNSFCSRTATGVPASFQWTQTAGSGSPTFSAATSATTNYTNSTAGTKTIQVEVSDGTTPVTATKKIGVVSVGADNCTIAQTNANLEKVIGPVVILGDPSCSPWTYWDYASLAYGQQIPPVMLGTDDVAAVGAAITGPTSYTLSEGNPGIYPVRISSATAFTSQLAVNDVIVIPWTTSEGAGTGRYLEIVTGIVDANTITVSGNYFGACARGFISCPTTFSTLYKGKPANIAYPSCDVGGLYSPCFTYGLWGYGGSAGVTNWNYYDLVVFLYRLGQRTGIDTYTQYAKDIADLWWQFALDHGAQTPQAARVQALAGAIARAVDGDGLTQRVTDLYGLIWASSTQSNKDNTIALPSSDKREMGYATAWVALAARFDSTHRSAYCTRLQSMVDSWISVQNGTYGFYNEDLYAGNASYPNSALENSPWREQIAIKALQYTYEALTDSAVCNDTSGRPASLLTSIGLALNWDYNAGISSSNKGVYYQVNTGSNILGAVYHSGTISATNGSTTLSGTGTSFVTDGLGDGNHWIGPTHHSSISADVNYTWVQRIASCASNTSCTLANPWPNATYSVPGGFYSTTTASTNCGSGSAVNCETDISAGGGSLPNGAVSLVRLMPGNYGWMYRQTGDSQWKTKGDALFASVFGGPASGPGYSDACAGPGCTGVVTDTVSALRDCASWAAPCTVGGTPWASNGTKNFPEAGGFTDADRYLSDRLASTVVTQPSSRFYGNSKPTTSVVIH